MPVEEAVRRGLAQHPELRSAASDVRAAEIDISVAKDGYLPSVSVSAGPRRLVPDSWSYEVTAAQMLHDWGRVKSHVESARSVQRQLSEDLLVKSEAAALDIIEIYLDALLAERHFQTSARYIERLHPILEMTRLRSRGGYSDQSEPDRAALELARAEERLATDQFELADARRQFETLVGAPAEPLSEPSPPAMSRHVSLNELDTLIRDSPQYRRALEDTRSARAQLADAKAAMLPQLNLEATTLRRDIGGRAETDFTIALRLRMSPLQGFSKFKQASGAQQRIESAQWREGMVERDIRREVEGLVNAADLLTGREQTLRRQVAEAESLERLYREQFEAGHRDIIDLLNIQRERFDAERQLSDLRIQRLRIQYRIAAQLGLIQMALEGSEPSHEG